MADAYLSAAIRTSKLEVAIALSTDLCRDAQAAHQLGATSAIALGRLLTATALVDLSSKRNGSTSFQILTQGRMRQLFADHDHHGHGRGFARPAELAFPPLTGETLGGRRAVGHAIFPGKLHVVRAHENGKYSHSTVELASGEVDADVEHFLEQSDQVSTALRADVLLGAGDRVEHAGGILVQCLPSGDEARLRAIRAQLHEAGLVEGLRTHGDAAALLRAILPDAEVVAEPRTIRWKCRCSRERVLDMLRVLSPSELAEMALERQPIEVGCDLCATQYVVPIEALDELVAQVTKAEG